MNEKERKARRTNETPEQGMGNFEKHIIDIATSDKSKKMKDKVKVELEHIPKGSGPQNELRLIYWDSRMHSLGKKVTSKQTAKEVLEGCISRLKNDYPDFHFLYDENFFNKCG